LRYMNSINFVAVEWIACLHPFTTANLGSLERGKIFVVKVAIVIVMTQ